MARHRWLRAIAGTLACCASIFTPAVADEAGRAPDGSPYGILDPTPDSALRTFTPDRPARSTSPITVDAGRFQVESDFVTITASGGQGTATRTIQTADPLLKLGVTRFMDVEVMFGGFVDTRTTDDATGATLSKGRGAGDVTLLSKINLIGNDGGKVAFALAPYLIVPSGTRTISAGQVEGGLIAPLTLSLPDDFSVTLQTELDALANVNGPGTHLNVTDIVNVSHPIPGLKDVTGTAEFYSSLSTEPHTPDVYTADLALAYLVDASTQLDVGTNLGLNRGAPDVQVYSGVAHRF